MHDAPQLSDDIVAISNIRHRDVLLRIISSLASFDQNFQKDLPPDLLSVDLRDALAAVGEITGATTPDAVLDLIFSTFCIGK